MSAVILLRDVQVAMGERLLLDVPRLAIEEGERVAIVGPNGAGKSTLLKVIGGLVEARQGHVQVLGHPLGPGWGASDGRAWRRDIGLLMQGLHLVPRLSALENVVIGALARLVGFDGLRSWCRWYPPTLVAEAQAALEALGLQDRSGVRADRLSGGERQKVALARLQLQRPRLLLADEPTSALDPAATQAVCDALRATAAAPGRTLLTVVHDLELLPLLATRVIGMAGGRVLFDRQPAQVPTAQLQALYQRAPAEVMPGVQSLQVPVTWLANA